jgi:hypothetical protein
MAIDIEFLFAISQQAFDQLTNDLFTAGGGTFV